MPCLAVNHLKGDAFAIEVRGHTVVTDRPRPDHGERGPAPIELFVSGLAASVAATVVAYLRDHGQPYGGVRVECDWRMREAPPQRLEAVRLRILVPRQPDRDTYLGLIDAFNRSPVRATLSGSAPAIAIELRAYAEWAALSAQDPVTEPVPRRLTRSKVPVGAGSSGRR